MQTGQTITPLITDHTPTAGRAGLHIKCSVVLHKKSLQRLVNKIHSSNAKAEGIAYTATSMLQNLNGLNRICDDGRKASEGVVTTPCLTSRVGRMDIVTFHGVLNAF
jgi:hypothetical protein